MFLLLCLQCVSPSAIQLGVPTEGPVSENTDTDTLPIIIGEDSDTGGGQDSSTTEPVPTWPQACDARYDPDILPTFDLQFAQADWEAMQSDCYSGIQQYRPVQFSYEGETVDAMARLKGNWSWSCDKFQFVVSFNEVDPDARFHGLRKMMFDAAWYDRTFLHERLAFSMFERRGLPYSCANSARVNINGDYYGLYTNIERIDREYLERNFEEPDGNLYQAGNELKTNEDIGDIQDLVDLQSAYTIDELDALIDLDEAVAEWATEAMIPAMDNYWAGVEINYYLYDHPTRGFVYLPYDMDLSFGDSKMPNGDLIWPDTVNADPILHEHPGWRKEDLFKRVLADEYWCNRFVEELSLARTAYDPDAMRADIDTWDAQIIDAFNEEPHKLFTQADHTESIQELRSFLDDRAAVVDRWLAQGNHCPAY